MSTRKSAGAAGAVAKVRAVCSARRPRRAWRITAGLAAATLLAGCAAIPSTGPVQPGLTNLQQVDQTWQSIPSGPSSGASQKDVVRGFVEAASSSSDDYAVAREFLAPEYAGQWDPHLGVLIDDGSRPYRAEGETAGVLSLAAVAKVDENGVMLPVQPGPATDMRFEFTRVAGEWRISSAPAGVILDSTTFTSIWSPRQLYFVGPGELLVPDTRWFLNRSSLPTAIVSTLLQGPSERLREAVHSGFPSGTSLVSNSVPVVDGRARIDLSGALLQGGQNPLAEVYQQVRMSLQTVADVNGFDLYVDGVQVQPPPEGAGPRVLGEVYEPSVLVDGRFGTLISGRFTASPGFAEGIAAFDPKAVSLSLDGKTAAVLNGEGVTRLDDEGRVLVDARGGLLEPGVDVFGYVWTAQRSSAQQLQIWGPDGSSATIPAPWLAGREPVAVRLSPEGARIAALVPSDSGSQVLVAGVVRGENGMPIATTEEADVQMWAVGRPVDLDWVGQQGFVALTRVDDAGKLTVGAPGRFGVEQGGSISGGMQVSGGGGRTQLRVLGENGDLFAAQGSGWQRLDSGVSLLAKRG